MGYISVLSSGIPDFGSLGISFFALQSFCHISVPLEMSYYSAVLSPAFDKSLQYSHEGNFLSYSPLTSVFAGWLFCSKWRLRLTCRRSRTYPELRDISFLCSAPLPSAFHSLLYMYTLFFFFFVVYSLKSSLLWQHFSCYPALDEGTVYVSQLFLLDSSPGKLPPGYMLKVTGENWQGGRHFLNGQDSSGHFLRTSHMLL